MHSKFSFAHLSLVLVLALASQLAPAQTTDPILRRAEEGRQFGRSQQPVLPTLDANGNLVIQGNTMRPKDLVPGADKGGTEDVSALAGDQAALERAGTERRKSNETATNFEGEAYRAARNAPKLDTRKATEDQSLWQTTASALAPTNLAATFGACRARTEYQNAPGDPAFTQVERTCEHINKPEYCVKTRTLSSYDEELTLLDAFQDGITESIDVPLGAPTTPQGVAITGAQATVAWSGTVANVEITTQPAADNGWQTTLRVTYNEAAQVCTLGDGSTCSAGAAGCTCTRPPQSAGVTVRVHVTGYSEHISSDPEGCPAESDGFCDSLWTCESTDAPDVNGAPPGPELLSVLTPLYPDSALNAPPSSTSPQMCWRARARYDCKFYLGSMDCWTNSKGEVVCPENTTGNTGTNTCGTLGRDPSCALVRSQCSQDGRGTASGFCYVSTDTYRCSTQVQTSTPVAVTHTDCDGRIRCMGDECIKADHALEKPRGFQKAQATLTLLEHLTNDRHQDPLTGKVSVMAGKPFECRKALGSSVDCCTDGAGASDTEWMERYNREIRRGSAATLAAKMRADGEGETGSWSDYAAGNSDYALLGKSITSGIETITGGTGSVPRGSENIEEMNDSLMTESKQTKYPDSGYMCSAEEFDLAQRKQLGQCLHVGSYCKRSAFGLCIEHRDTYCCYSSAIARMTEESNAGPNGIINGAFGTARQPQCGGFAVAGINAQAIDRMPMDEWIGHMQKGGAFPDPSNLRDAEQRYSQEKLTGNGSSLSDGDRPTALVRNQQRVAAVDSKKVRESMARQLASTRQGAIVEPTAAGEIGFGPAYTFTAQGVPGTVYVYRNGSRGSVSVTVSTRDATAHAGTHYQSQTKTLTWNDGESGLKTFQVTTLKIPNLRNRYALNIGIDHVDGGARVGNHDLATMVINYDPNEASEPPAGSGSLALKAFVNGAARMTLTAGRAVFLQVQASNFSLHDITGLRLTLLAPPGVSEAQLADPFCGGTSAYLTITNQGGRLAYTCAFTQPIPPGFNFGAMVSAPHGFPPGQYTVNCTADASESATGVCSATVTYQ